MTVNLATGAATALNGDGRADLLLQNPSTGGLYGWTMNGPTILASNGDSIRPNL